MYDLKIFRVFPKVPEPLAFLEALSRNLWWSYEPEAKELFRRIDARLWALCGRNPLSFLAAVDQSRLERLAQDEGFIGQMDVVQEEFIHRVELPADRGDQPFGENETIAYLSMEFGLHESIPLFAGGLGVLAGDHLKSADNMALPLTGIGLMYRQGYLNQFLDEHGWQQESYPETEFYQLPIRRARDGAGNEIKVTVAGPAGDIHALVWRLNVGRVALYLMDTNLKENSAETREITSRLYGGDLRRRLYQEAVLGIGGIRALTALGLFPKVTHMNEGHSAFANLERLALIMRTYHVDLKTAMEIVPRTTVFTTHTPVPAGHDEFPVDMIEPVLKPFESALGIGLKEIIAWGQPPGGDESAPVSMFILGSRLANYCNGVSKLHGSVARKMWAHLWPKKTQDEVPIIHVTNGIHVPTWLSHEHGPLYERYIGPDWHTRQPTAEQCEQIDQIYDEELWRAHENCRARLIATCRERMVNQYSQRNAPADTIAEAASVLEQGILTIGFARRFASYKRANLLLRDPQRLEAILTHKKYPVQLIYAGKAHPRDNEGKELIRRFIEFAHRPSVRNRIVFIENYDMHVARHMYQGADVWLNTPRRPMEACGTSGMKAAVNGCLNLSIMDGWWAEAYNPEAGWAIGQGEDGYGDWEYQDSVDAQALYNVLENEVVPAFYNRRNGAAPGQWCAMMKAAVKLGMQHFNSLRMVGDYNDYYQPAGRQFDQLVAQEAAKAGHMAQRMDLLHRHWEAIHIDQPQRETDVAYNVGDTFTVTSKVYIGELPPQEVEVQLYSGILKSVNTVADSTTSIMHLRENLGDGHYLYEGVVTCESAGRFGYTARIIPTGDTWIRNRPELLTWAQNA